MNNSLYYVPFEHQLKIHKIELSSPGQIDVLGIASIIKEARELIKDRYRNKIERDQGMANIKKTNAETENIITDTELKRLEVIKASVDILKSLGHSDSEIREIMDNKISTPRNKLLKAMEENDISLVEPENTDVKPEKEK